jgi:FMN phosphatase YigB (HAD superfamily)
LRLRGGQASTGAGGGGAAPRESNHVIVLDVDGTLYGAESNIEQQIVANIHRFALSCFELTPEQSDELHRKYGSTIAGLKAEHALSRDQERRFYREVYGAIDYSLLLGGSGGAGDSSGYKHCGSVREILTRSGARMAIASNSPSWHVERVLAALGLSQLPWCAILTPDTVGWLTKSDAQFWAPLLER